MNWITEVSIFLMRKMKHNDNNKNSKSGYHPRLQLTTNRVSTIYLGLEINPNININSNRQLGLKTQ